MPGLQTQKDKYKPKAFPWGEVIDDKPEASKELVDNLQAAFPQESITAFGGELFALQYAAQHPREIGLVFTAMTMRRMDGITLANCVKRDSPGAAIFFVVQEENCELSAIAKQHGISKGRK